jgi:hypothetical protein
LAVVAHYVTNDRQVGKIWFLFISCPTDIPEYLFIEELLIDFREFVGEHSEENVALAV